MITLDQIKNWVWSTPILFLFLGVGLYLTILLKGVQFRYLWFALKQIVTKKHEGAKGDINHFEALMTSLAGAIGTGNIVGVATGIALGGMGAIFWMWVTALFSMATKYAESLLAVKYRQVDCRGEMIGGPMEYIEKGLSWRWMAIIFAFLGSLAAIGTGNLVQVNSIAEAVNRVWHIEPLFTGVFLAFLIGIVLVGGVRSIGHVAGILVPLMAFVYLVGGLTIVIVHYKQIPQAFSLIFKSAFSGQAAFGGFAGASVLMAIRTGVMRSVFTNEAGLGISSIAAAAAITDNPGRQAMITMTGALISTVVVCTITALAIALTGMQGVIDVDGQVIVGASVVILAFESVFSGGAYVVSIGLVLFAFSTIIAWAYYGEKCFEYLFGERAALWYRIIFTFIAVPGAVLKLETVWSLADIANGLMAIPNLIALIGLSVVIVKETNSFLVVVKEEDSTS